MTSKQRFAGGKGGEEKPEERPPRDPFSLHHAGGAAPQPPHRMQYVCGGVAPSARGLGRVAPSCDPTTGKSGYAKEAVLEQIKLVDKVLQSVRTEVDKEPIMRGLRALIEIAKHPHCSKDLVCATIMNAGMVAATRSDGRVVEEALREVQKDAGIPEEIAGAIRSSLGTLEQDRATIAGK